MRCPKLLSSAVQPTTVAAVFFAVAGHGATAAATPCEALSRLVLTLDGTAEVLLLTAADVAAKGGVPAYCLVDTIISSNGNAQQSQIEDQFWLPESQWNGRFLGTGSGGFAGAISTAPLTIGVQQGYATANSDMGTGILFNCTDTHCGSAQQNGQTPPAGLYGDDAAIQDFGYGATHLMTLAGKQIVQAYYGQAADYSYFHGCSTGGQQALMEAQRYPADYDGIVAGAAAYDRTHLHVAAASSYETNNAQPDAYLTDEGLALSHAASLKQCAGADGGLAADDYLMQPAKCAFNAVSLQCTGARGEIPCTDPNGTTCSCLVPDEAVAMNGEWAGALDNNARVIYPGFERSSEEPIPLQAPNFLGNLGMNWQEAGTEPAFDGLLYWALGPNFAWAQLFASTGTPQGELASVIAQIDHTAVGNSNFAGVLNANSSNLSSFNARGGKLIIYAGYDDPLIPTASSIDYYNTVLKTDPGNVANYLRLFLAPGLWHCHGGPGANSFGNVSNTQPPQPGAPADDVLGAMVSWVETNTAPNQVVATKYVNDTESRGIAFQRPLCAYPANAAYNAALGGSALASSYQCLAGPLVKNQNFSAIYGPR